MASVTSYVKKPWNYTNNFDVYTVKYFSQFTLLKGGFIGVQAHIPSEFGRAFLHKKRGSSQSLLDSLNTAFILLTNLKFWTYTIGIYTLCELGSVSNENIIYR